jgi:hypothetical protein
MVPGLRLSASYVMSLVILPLYASNASTRHSLVWGMMSGFLDKQLAMANHVYSSPGQTSSYPVDPSWYVDSATTDHLSGELAKMQMSEPGA